MIEPKRISIITNKCILLINYWYFRSGRPSVHGENPHIVMLSYKGFGGYGQFCDGSIIHNRFILTAAHCFVGWDESPTTYEVVVGAYNKVEKSEKQKTYLLEDVSNSIYQPL